MNSDRLTAIFLLIICGVLWYEVLPYSMLASFFPKIVIGVLALLSVILLVRSSIKGEKKWLFRDIDKKYIIFAVAVIAVWIGMIPVLGFFVSSIVFFNVLVWLMGSKKKSLPSIALSFVVVGCIVSIFYFIFKEILLVPLPQGILF
ncbi:MAG: tripartite tricarboxylate transporter TctB family protein [Syntrophaceae bacterium]|nr:tripartite tricarboxylate transporter TctB family protein [Syntrophaceae bacterium]